MTQTPEGRQLPPEETQLALTKTDCKVLRPLVLHSFNRLVINYFMYVMVLKDPSSSVVRVVLVARPLQFNLWKLKRTLIPSGDVAYSVSQLNVFLLVGDTCVL
ncbi:hypothetical protein E2C01_068528 [Portunus trituberculatus]|uniref:Uncharacterized protein n=1 Tax=Portunus trituberculatus TaxID=210409 RepID=A0A5B7HZP0_PORTR|nr:hypothetical protein [Portunus trituberculatus]